MDKRTRKLLRENNKSEKVLPKEARNLLTDIVVYLRMTNLSMYNQEIIRRDITQMLIEGDERGEYAKDVIGEDYKVFCDAIISSFPEPTAKEKRLTLIEQTFAYASVLLTVLVIINLINLIGSFDNWNGKIEFPLSSVLAFFCTLALVEVFENKQKLVNNGMSSLYVVTLILCVVLLAGIFFEVVSGNVLFSVHILVIVPIIIALFAASIHIENILDKKSGS